MITDENAPEMQAALNGLQSQIAALTSGRVIDRSFIHELSDLLRYHRSKCRMNGVDFPVLVAFMVPRLGAIDLYRADLELPGIRVAIVNFVKKYPDVRPIEVAQAITMAWPHIRKDDLIEKALPHRDFKVS